MAKPIRLGKAAGELNVGMSTLVEFLESNGVSIDASPNTKLAPEQYDMLRTEFAADQSLKEQSKKTSVTHEKRETISLRDKKEAEAPIPEPVVEPEPEVVVEPEPVVVDEPIAEPVVEEKPEVVEEPVEVEAPKAEKDIEVKEEPKAKESEDKSGMKILGKIDLDKINTKTRPDKSKKPVKTDSKKEEPKKAEKQQPKVEKPAAEKPKSDEKPKDPVPSKETETIRVERTKLAGPNVVGKIVLPVEKPKGPSQAERRKRKRVRKVDVNKQQSQQNQNKGNQGNNRGGHKKGGKAPKPEITERDIQKEIKDTLARLSNKGGKSKGSKNRKAKRENVAAKRLEEEAHAELQERILKLTEFVTVSELATMMNVSSTEVISACMSLGIFASINQRLDAETIQIIAEEFGFEAEFVSAEVQEAIPVIEDKEEDLKPRPPIITVMGHVDHGKTSLLDRIRDADVVEGEAGGITQHIGAYSVTLKDNRKMTFLDTPGHEAFTAMRARGAQVTDVAVIIIAADDDVMPQTKEAISHAQAAEVPMVFAINKIDRPGANPDKVKEQLSQMNILVEDWGGKYQCQEISAKMNLNIDELLEKILLEAELLDLKANPDRNAKGTVIESSLDIGKGYVTNMLVETGTLRIGDTILVGRNHGKIKAMHDEHGTSLTEVGPSKPVSVLGVNGAPSAGDTFHVLDDEKEAKSIAVKREQLYREQGLRTTKHITLDEIGRRLAIGDFKELNLIVKGDVDGSIEALSDSLLRLSTEEIQVNIIHKGVGAISEADVNLASASDAIILGFQVRPSMQARKLAETEQIDIRLYSVIYKAIDEIKAAMEGMLSPDIEEKVIGTAEIRETFNISKVGTIAGCFVTDGLIKRSSKIRIIRDGIVVHEGALGSLKRFKDDVKEVKNNYECGLNIEKYNDIKEGDVIEAYEQVEVARKL
ncbi:MAG: translation initiation factor IF-2 [Crocinitomicaceae bacterium]|nr:translation initiation factor IF-2 [Crocinitomicaceae bacterium]MCH2236195.1 translation initiation factor IF-2 [Crocinitomicaceae bacterium]